MRRLILFFILIAIFSCVKDKTKSESGYNCVNGQCTATFENPTFLTLQDCQSVCSIGVIPPSTGKGRVKISCIYPMSCGSVVYWFSYITIGIGSIYADVALDHFTYSRKFYTGDSYLQYLDVELAVGTYYYKATLIPGCNVTSKEKSGSFTITSGRYTVISVDLFNN
jgi:hypothetical protein